MPIPGMSYDDPYYEHLSEEPHFTPDEEPQLAVDVCEAIERAADLIDVTGLAHGNFIAWDGDKLTYCGLGALRVMVYGTANTVELPNELYRAHYPLFRQASRLLDMSTDCQDPEDNAYGWVPWNDSHEKADVVQRMREVALAERIRREQYPTACPKSSAQYHDCTDPTHVLRP